MGLGSRWQIKIFLQILWYLRPVAYATVCPLNPFIDIHVLLADLAFEPGAARGERHEHEDLS